MLIPLSNCLFHLTNVYSIKQILLPNCIVGGCLKAISRTTLSYSMILNNRVELNKREDGKNHIMKFTEKNIFGTGERNVRFGINLVAELFGSVRPIFSDFY